MLTFGKKYTIKDISPIMQINSKIIDSTRILIVDDEPFSYLDSLRNSGYNIHQIMDIQDIHGVQGYHIVISDVDGVAKAIDPEGQGAGFIKQVSKSYPEKITGVYSGKTHKMSRLPDDTMVFQKDDDLETWKEKIDELILMAHNPVTAWKKIAFLLIDKEIPCEDISEIEHDYVRRIVKNKSFDGFPSKRFKIEKNVIDIVVSIAVQALSAS